VFADGHARVVAENIAAEIGGSGETSQFKGYGFCYVEVGGGVAAYGAGNFYHPQAPAVTLRAPTRYWHWAKVLVEKYWLWRWFSSRLPVCCLLVTDIVWTDFALNIQMNE
jgi:sulfide:quinone oxidoreductase